MKIHYITSIKTETNSMKDIKKILRDCQRIGGDFEWGNKGAYISFGSDGSSYIDGGSGMGAWIRTDRSIKELINILVYDFNILLK